MVFMVLFYGTFLTLVFFTWLSSSALSWSARQLPFLGGLLGWFWSSPDDTRLNHFTSIRHLAAGFVVVILLVQYQESRIITAGDNPNNHHALYHQLHNWDCCWGICCGLICRCLGGHFCTRLLLLLAITVATQNHGGVDGRLEAHPAAALPVAGRQGDPAGRP